MYSNTGEVIRLGVCPTPSGYFRDENGQLIPAGCKKYDCPHCGPVQKNKILDRAKKGFAPDLQLPGGRVRFMTLTTSPRCDADQLMKFFARLRAYLAKPRYRWTKKGKRSKRKYSYRNIKYFWTKEYGDVSGMKHLHVMLNAYIPQSLLKKAWWYATKGTSWIVDIRSSQVFNPAGYMTKYMTKEWRTDSRFKKGERRFGFSRSPLFKAQAYNPQKKLNYIYNPHLDKDEIIRIQNIIFDPGGP